MLKSVLARVLAGGLLLAGGGPAAVAGEGALGDLGGYVFVANRTSPEIAVIEVERDAVAKRVALGGIPAQFVISEQLAKLAASHPAERAVSIADLARGGFEVVRPGLVPE
jgi:YVTN family beta-propeller protein